MGILKDWALGRHTFPVFVYCIATHKQPSGHPVGCPKLSIVTFVVSLAIEPLAIKIRDNPNIIGFCYGNRQEIGVLYADDIMIMLGVTDASLKAIGPHAN